MSTSRGSTWEYAGTSRTSSNVKPSPKNFLDWGIFACGALMIDAMCKDRGAEKYAPKVFLCHELDSLCYKNFPTQVCRKLFKKKITMLLKPIVFCFLPIFLFVRNVIEQTFNS